MGFKYKIRKYDRLLEAEFGGKSTINYQWER
jgi:hypothetical protein